MQASSHINVATALGFENARLRVGRGGGKPVVVDFDAVQFLSSGELTSLLLIGKELQKRGGVLRLADIPSHVDQVIELSKFYSQFSHFGSVGKAAEG